MAKDKTEVKNSGEDKLLEAFASLSKKYGDGAVMTGDTIIKTERRSTGSLGLDIIIGGGYGKGRFTEIYGPESSGKSTITLHAIAQAQKDEPHLRCAIIDTENAFDRTYAEALGVDVDKLIISQPDHGDAALEIADELIQTGLISVLVIDSIAALVPKAELEGEMGESKMGLHARLMSQACRKMTPATNATKTTVLWINQIREKIGVMFGSPETTPGGNAMKFYASTRLDVRKSAGEKDKDGNVLTSHVKVKTVKNKLAPPFQMTEFEIVFGQGIDRNSEILNIAVANGIIQKSGSWYSYGDTRMGQGEVAVRDLLADNPELAQEIEAKIRNLFEI